jgi:hypothetical protein
MVWYDSGTIRYDTIQMSWCDYIIIIRNCLIYDSLHYTVLYYYMWCREYILIYYILPSFHPSRVTIVVQYSTVRITHRGELGHDRNEMKCVAVLVVYCVVHLFIPRTYTLFLKPILQYTSSRSLDIIIISIYRSTNIYLKLQWSYIILYAVILYCTVL